MQKEIQHKDKWKLFANMGTPLEISGHDEELVSFHRDVELPEQKESDTESDEEEESGGTFSYKAPDLGDEIDLDDI